MNDPPDATSLGRLAVVAVIAIVGLVVLFFLLPQLLNDEQAPPLPSEITTT